MLLAEATLEQMATELDRRGIDYLLIATDASGAVQMYSPHAISGAADRVAFGMFKMVRDYLNSLEARGHVG
jgi:hypothetical protein